MSDQILNVLDCGWVKQNQHRAVQHYRRINDGDREAIVAEKVMELASLVARSKRGVILIASAILRALQRYGVSLNGDKLVDAAIAAMEVWCLDEWDPSGIRNERSSN